MQILRVGKTSWRLKIDYEIKTTYPITMLINIRKNLMQKRKSKIRNRKESGKLKNNNLFFVTQCSSSKKKDQDEADDVEPPGKKICNIFSQQGL